MDKSISTPKANGMIDTVAGDDLDDEDNGLWLLQPFLTAPIIGGGDSRQESQQQANHNTHRRRVDDRKGSSSK